MKGNINIITYITRQKIADEMFARKIWYHGNQNEPDFLGRIFNLKELPSRDHRYGTAYSDIYQHTVNNYDYGDDWIYTDSRINLLYCDDDTYLRFIEQTIHPRTRTNASEVALLVDMYNRYLSVDGFEVVKSEEISGCTIFKAQLTNIGINNAVSKTNEIKRCFNTEYVNKKIETINQSLLNNAGLAIGTAKELLETACKSIIKQKTDTFDSKMDLPQLVKEAIKHIEVKPQFVDDPKKAEDSTKKIINGINSIVQGISEMRNTYGTGHGQHPDFVGLDKKYAQLFVGVVSDLVIFMLNSNGETAELIEQ